MKCRYTYILRKSHCTPANITLVMDCMSVLCISSRLFIWPFSFECAYFGVHFGHGSILYLVNKQRNFEQHYNIGNKQMRCMVEKQKAFDNMICNVAEKDGRKQQTSYIDRGMLRFIQFGAHKQKKNNGKSKYRCNFHKRQIIHSRPLLLCDFFCSSYPILLSLAIDFIFTYMRKIRSFFLLIRCCQ